jgi:hypothetical protein
MNINSSDFNRGFDCCNNGNWCPENECFSFMFGYSVAYKISVVRESDLEKSKRMEADVMLWNAFLSNDWN